tara:strand:+ start:450 stop:857 length:408 start_codon:yes stop_codon:yes gene_type:complete
MAGQITIQEYSEKTFVVRGETRPFKQSLKNLGGKWNSRLNEKDSDEKFGAWLFFSSKRDSVEEWFSKGCKVDEEPKYENQPKFENQQNISLEDFKRLERKVDKIIELLSSNVTRELDIEDDLEEVMTTKVKKRLL